MRYPVTPDGRYFVVRGRLWRMTNPALPEIVRQQLTHELMDARRAVRAAKLAGDVEAERASHAAVDLLVLAHDRGCEAELAETLAADLEAGRLPDVVALRARFAPDPACVPLVRVELAPLASYQSLLGSAPFGEAA